jgi:RNA polymerase sigma-70 factor, ECF subfamily
MDQDLISRVLDGDEQSRDALFRLVEGRVRAYLSRVMLDNERATDLAHDTIVSVLRSLDTLREPDRFWPWVFTIASNKARQLSRHQSRCRTTLMSSLSDPDLLNLPAAADGGAEHLSRKELAELTRQALSRLDYRYRMALALRFYEDLSHGEIALALGCSEIGARALFFRAKRAMTRELKGLGVAKGALVAALVAFGESTLSPSASAGTIAISPAALTESIIAGLVPARTKALMAAVLGILILAGYLGRSGGQATPARSVAGHVHFIEQSMVADSEEVAFPGTRSKGAYEQWLKFPEGFGSPMLTRMQRWDPHLKGKLCWWIQNEEANYYIHGGKREVYIQNHRLYRSSLVTRLLPTDPEPFCEFVRRMDGGLAYKDIADSRDPETGFLARRTDSRFKELGPFVTVYEYSAQSDDLFKAPTGMPVHDERDVMHRRGWTFFRIEGQLDGRPVQGIGRLPFVYNARKSHGQWLRISLDGRPAAVDTGERALVLEGNRKGDVLRGGTLFQGMPRPWSGFHTIDCIRRDAADHRFWYELVVLPGKERVQISVVDDQTSPACMARYVIHLDRDLLEQVEFRRGQDGFFDEKVGDLSFTYLENTEGHEKEFESPTLPSAGTEGPDPGVLWPWRLLVGRNSLVPKAESRPAHVN